MDIIRVGFSSTLSGKYSLQGIISFNGIKLWESYINNRGGILVESVSKRLPVELVYYKDSSNPDNIKKIYKKLITEDNVDILLGPYSSSLTLEAAKISNHYNKTLWNYGGSSDDIFRAGFKNIISSITSSSKYFIPFIDLILTIDPGIKNVALAYARESNFSKNIVDGITNYNKSNINFHKLEFKSGSRNLDNIVKSISSENCEVVLIAGRAEDDFLLTQNLLKAIPGIKSICAVAGAINEFKNRLDAGSEGVCSTSQWEPNIQINPEFGLTVPEFCNLYYDEYKSEPDYTAAQSFNIGLILEKCISETKTIADDELRAIGKKIKINSFYGDFKCDNRTGEQIGHSMIVIQWQNGKKEIVYPENLSTSKFIYPKKRAS